MLTITQVVADLAGIPLATNKGASLANEEVAQGAGGAEGAPASDLDRRVGTAAAYAAEGGTAARSPSLRRWLRRLCCCGCWRSTEVAAAELGGQVVETDSGRRGAPGRCCKSYR